MHLTNCLHPKLIRNPYSHDLMYVPCGKCEACLTSKSFTMVKRLDVESHLSKYVVFATLTYNNDNVPTLRITDDKKFFYDCTFVHTPDNVSLHFSVDDLDLNDKDKKFLDKVDHLHYLSHYDAQCFIKRLRINLRRYFISHNQDEEKSLLRFYLCGEYGPRNYRPHFHFLLFFDSDFTSSCIQSLIDKSWPFGFTDSSFVQNSASTYVAQYLNCTAHLPAVLRFRQIRPFSHFSRCPTIGANFFTDAEIQRIFDFSSPCFDFADYKSRKIESMPLWRFVEDRVFPKLPRFGRISHFERIALYRISSSIEVFSSSDFLRWCKQDECSFDQLHPLLSELSDHYKCESTLLRIWNISKHVAFMSSKFGVSIETYVNHIEDYYKNVEYEKLRSQYNFQSAYVDAGHDVRHLVWFDRFWLERIKDISISDLTLVLRNQLESYQIDISQFLSEDSITREKYWLELSYLTSFDYLDHKVTCEKIVKDTTKTKKKNDYLDSQGIKSLSEIYG